MIRKEKPIIPVSLESYQIEDNALRVRRSKIGGLLVILLTPSGTLLDKFLYPELGNEFIYLVSHEFYPI